MGIAAATMMAGSFVLGASAAGGAQIIDAYLSPDITVKYEGSPVTLRNAWGTQVFPIAYQGTVYVPIRAVSGIFSTSVEWDGTTRTVLLGDTPGSRFPTYPTYPTYPTDSTDSTDSTDFTDSTNSRGVDLIDTYEPYAIDYRCYHAQSSERKTENIGGIKVDHWLMLRGHATEAYYNIGGKYDMLTFSVAATLDSTLYVYGDNESLLQEITLTANQVPKEVTVSLMNTTQLHFYYSGDPTQSCDAGIFNAYLY